MNDKEISKLLLAKDIKVFDYIMDKYNKLLWLVVGNILEKVGTSEDVEDCISDVYLKLFENPKLYDCEKGTLKSFLVRVSKNHAIDIYRKITKSNVTEFDDSVHFDDEDDYTLKSIIQKENKEKLLNALNLIKEPDKEIIIRRYILDEKPKVISEKMLLSVKEIENKLYQGKLKLKNILEQGGFYYAKQ